MLSKFLFYFNVLSILPLMGWEELRTFGHFHFFFFFFPAEILGERTDFLSNWFGLTIHAFFETGSQEESFLP